MNILSYHPSVQVYVACTGRDGAVSYYDLSDDVTSCRVTRNSDNASTFSATFQNVGGKYDNLITPMDRVVIKAQKDGASTTILAGYVNRVDRWRLFDRDFSMSGTDVLYKLQKTYFDPGLVYDSGLFSGSRNGSPTWDGYVGDIYKWLVEVGGWPESRIAIGALPDEVVEWAKGLYATQAKDIAGSEKLVEAFYDVLVNTGAVTASAGGGGPMTSGAGNAMNGAPKVTSATGGLSADKRQTILNTGFSLLGLRYVFGGNSPTAGLDCSGFTQYCYRSAGIEIPRTARQQANGAGFVRVSPDAMQPGDIAMMLGNAGGGSGDHVVMYAGDGNIIHETIPCCKTNPWTNKSRFSAFGYYPG